MALRELRDCTCVQLAIQRVVAVASARRSLFLSPVWQIEHRIICSLLRLPPPSLSPSFLPSFSIHHSAFSDRKGAEERAEGEVGSRSARRAARSFCSCGAFRPIWKIGIRPALLSHRTQTLARRARESSRSEEKSRHRLLEREEASLTNYSFPVNIQQTFTHRCYNLESMHT